MIHNQIELAREVGSRTNDVSSQRRDIQTAVRRHTDGQVWLFLKEAYVEVRNNLGAPTKERMAYPFHNDEFWKSVEYVQEEAQDYDEDFSDEEEEDILDRYGIRDKRPHEFHD